MEERPDVHGGGSAPSAVALGERRETTPIPRRIPAQIVYKRFENTSNELYDYGVEINTIRFIWSPDLAIKSSGEHVTAESRERIILRRHTMPDPPDAGWVKPNASIAKGVAKVTADHAACAVRRRILDPRVCLPSLHQAWRHPEAPAAYLNLSSIAWVNTFVELTPEDELAEELNPNSCADVRTKLRGPSLSTSAHGNQFHWDGTVYDDAQGARRIANRDRWSDRVIRLRGEAAAGLNANNVKYLVDWVHVTASSYVNSLVHWHAYSPKQTKNLGLSSPLRTTPESSRLIPGFLSIPMGHGQTLVLHNVVYCPSFTDNVLSAVHITPTTNWTPTFQGLLSPGGHSFLLSDFRPDTDSVGLEYDTRQQRRVLCLSVNVTNGRPWTRPGSSTRPPE
jgi:hypothetical protein